MKLLSQELVSLEYRDQIRQDLARATFCRFVVAYVSLDGLDSIGRHLLQRALRDSRSFGIASLSCSCGYEPLIKLQQGLPALRLKYFMDPKVSEAEEPNDLALFHSKLVYLGNEKEGKAIIYIGSHNWSRRALGSGGPRNAEASLRFEVDFLPEDLEGIGASMASLVNRHLLDAWNMPLCLPATDANRATFEEWYAKGCRRAVSSPLQETTVVLTVRSNAGDPATPDQWMQLQGRGIYLQALEEDDGKKVWHSGDRLLVFVWESSSALQAARQPVILQCRVTTYKAGPASDLRGTNQSDNPIDGFEAVIFDHIRLAALQNGSNSVHPRVTIWSGHHVNVFDFEFPTARTDSLQVDNGIQPRYQFHLEVERVIFPADGPLPTQPRLIWNRETFAVAESRDSAKFQSKPGFYVEPKLRDEMLKCLREVFLTPLDKARVLPFSEMDRAKVGKRVSRHPLHDTFIGYETKQVREGFYGKSPLGALVADIDSPEENLRVPKAMLATADQLLRVQKVFTMPFADLFELWEAVPPPRHDIRDQQGD